MTMQEWDEDYLAWKTSW